ncbi:MAG: polysaccharide pyruvyl transferase family protein [Candidatus Methanoperedens sp.]|nr:polysaccharide pyruvyl transferase family protein [Candidatus Methanoperedens sp.]
MKNKNILLIGNYGNYNIGDETLLKVIVLGLLEKDDQAKISIPVRNPEFIDIYHADISRSLKSFNVYDIKELLNCLIRSDKVIVGGGGIWSGYTGKLAKLIPFFLIISKILGKEVIVKSVGLYNTAPGIEKILVNLSFFFVDQCSVRDEESFKNIWSLNKKVNIDNDLALELPAFLSKQELGQKYESLLKETPEYNILSHIKDQDKYIIGLSIKPLKNLDKTRELIDITSKFINIANTKYNPRIHFAFFPFAGTNSDIENDELLTDEIIKKVDFKENITVISRNNPIIWFLLTRSVNIFIGMRFHSIIFAFVNNITLLAIPYENKVLNFIKDVNLQNVVTLDNLDEKYLLKFLEDNIVTNIYE